MTTDVSIGSVPCEKAPTLTELLAPGLSAVRQFWRPFVLLQFGAFLLVATYFASASVQNVCRTLSRWHDHGGLLFSAAAAALAGGLLPEVAKAIFPIRNTADRLDEVTAARTSRLNDVAFACCAFAVNGIITDLQFRGIGLIFGYDGSLLTSAKKVMFDQFVTTPIYGSVYWAMVYRWRALGYSAVRLGRELSVRWYLQAVGPLLISGWCFWIPMDAMVYSMPKSLQLVLFCVVLAAWSLLMVFIATRVERVEGPVQP